MSTPGIGVPMLPLSVNSSTITPTSAVITWSGGLPNTTYSVCYGDSDMYDNLTGPSFTMNHLKSNTQYTVKIYGDDPSNTGTTPTPVCIACDALESIGASSLRCRTYGTVTFTTETAPFPWWIVLVVLVVLLAAFAFTKLKFGKKSRT